MSVTEFRTEIGLPPKECSPNGRLHWAVKAKKVKAFREACAWAFTEAKPRGWKPAPVVVDVEYRVFRSAGGYHPKDEDNARAALKAAIDALQDAGVVAGDSHRKVRWGSFSLFTTERSCKGKAGVTINVRLQ